MRSLELKRERRTRGFGLMPAMACGHTAQSKDEDGNPVCVICAGITPDARREAAKPDLEGREAKCTCGKTVPSEVGLAFFKHQEDLETDSFYCGCRGWD